MSEIKLCDYGCGRLAPHRLKNGKWCCGEHTRICPEVIKKANETKAKKRANNIKNKKPKRIINSGHICEYGCEQEAFYKFRNRKWCCEEHWTKCPFSIKSNTGENSHFYNGKHSPETIQKMSDIKKGKKPWNAGKSGIYSKKQLKKLSDSHKGQIPWNKGKVGVYTEEALLKMAASSRRENLSQETLKKMSDARKASKHQIMPNYNPAACKLIDEYGKQNNFNFQHAENGGEFCIKQLRYWVDGYDGKKNTVIETDEPHHFDSDGNLLECDIRRQNEIIEEIKCTFIRLKIDKYNKVINETRATKPTVTPAQIYIIS